MTNLLDLMTDDEFGEIYTFKTNDYVFYKQTALFRTLDCPLGNYTKRCWYLWEDQRYFSGDNVKTWGYYPTGKWYFGVIGATATITTYHLDQIEKPNTGKDFVAIESNVVDEILTRLKTSDVTVLNTKHNYKIISKNAMDAEYPHVDKVPILKSVSRIQNYRQSTADRTSLVYFITNTKLIDKIVHYNSPITNIFIGENKRLWLSLDGNTLETDWQFDFFEYTELPTTFSGLKLKTEDLLNIISLQDNITFKFLYGVENKIENKWVTSNATLEYSCWSDRTLIRGNVLSQ